jgi:uncharacterized membrane protein YhaH (DUF805 family)
MFKNKKREYWFWMVLFFINMLTFSVLMKVENSIQASFSIVMMIFCFGKLVKLADKIEEK